MTVRGRRSYGKKVTERETEQRGQAGKFVTLEFVVDFWSLFLYHDIASLNRSPFWFTHRVMMEIGKGP